MMTPEQEKRRDDIRGRCDEATPGPWEMTTMEIPDAPDWNNIVFGRKPGGAVARDIWDASCEDAEFIASARDDVPWLLSLLDAETARADAARVERDEARAALAKAQEGWANCDDALDRTKAEG